MLHRSLLQKTAPRRIGVKKITALVVQDLNSSGLFREVSKAKYISQITSFASPVQYSDWKAINVQALVTGAVKISSKDQLVVKFRSYDVFAGQELGDGFAIRRN